MQRRAAAVYFALFVLIGAGAYGFIQVGTTHPEIELPGESYSANENLTVGGQTYTVGEISVSGGGGHGGGGGSIESVLTTVNESAVSTAELLNGSTTQYQGGEWRVEIPNGSDVSQFRLVEVINVSQLLANDDAVEDELVQRNGQPHVVYTNQSIRPLDTYLPQNQTAGPFSEGGQLQYQAESGQVSATVRNVTAEAATLEWASPTEEELDLTEGGNVTLGGQDYFAHFPNENSVQLLSVEQHYETYQEELAYEDEWFERHAGLWAIVIISFLAAVFLLAAAYMPVKE